MTAAPTETWRARAGVIADAERIPINLREVEGRKDDADKPRVSLVMAQMFDALAAADAAARYGRAKYGLGVQGSLTNFLAVPGGDQRYFDAAMRHWAALRRGEAIDPESGLHHRCGFAWSCLAAAQWLIERDGPKSGEL